MSDDAENKRRVVALSGGVGGAKLAYGLSQILPPEDLTIVTNVGDDFEHLGLTICPDTDTVIYTLAGVADPLRGWGRRDETWRFMEALAALGGETWFQLGDLDLALHVERTRRLRAGQTLSEVTAEICRRLGVAPQVLPATDAPLRTLVATAEGELALQDYLVRRRCQPRVTGFRYHGAEAARPTPGLLAALAAPDLRAVILCPSNPFISLDPILAVPGLRAAVQSCVAPVIAVSPIVGGQAIKGPLAKMLRELGIAPGPVAIAAIYRDLIDGLILDREDAGESAAVECLGITPLAAPTVMRDEADKIALAELALHFADRLRRAASTSAIPDPRAMSCGQSYR